MIKKILISQTIKKKSEFDAYFNIQLSGTGSLGDYLSDKIKINLKLSRVRADTLGYPQIGHFWVQLQKSTKGKLTILEILL